MSDLYRLVYVSKNLLLGPESDVAAAVAQILAASKRNNAKVDVTGALMFNAGAFAQVLEGPRCAVEATFERIQRDQRHGDVTVLQCSPVERRGFPNWSMAFVGHSSAGHALWNTIAAESGFDLARLDGDQIFSMLHGLVLEEEGVPAAASVLPSAVPDSDRGPGIFDVDRVRAELPQPGQALEAAKSAARSAEQLSASQHSAERAPKQARSTAGENKTTSAVALAVFRAALASERQRTTELRNALDEMQVMLAASQERVDALQRERDLWAGRASLLATALGREAHEVTGGAEAMRGADLRSEHVGRPGVSVKIVA